MLEGLKKGIGSSVVIDYKTNTGKVVYAKGILKEILDDPVMLVVLGEDGTLWYVAFSSIVSMRIKGDEDNNHELEKE